MTAKMRAISEVEPPLSGATGDRRALLFANRKSGLGSVELGDVVGLLQDRGMTVMSVSPDTPAQIPDLIRSDASNADLVIIGGGDGTLNGCLPALIECQLPIGILPMGTANDLARTLAIPDDLAEAAGIIAGGHTAMIDVGVVNGHPFFNVASVGFSAEVAKFHRGERKKLLRRLSYPLSWLDAYKAHRHFHATITCDGKRRRIRCTMAAVGNGRHYGGGLTISEDAAIDDGWLRVSYVKPIGLWGLLRLLPHLRSGTLAKHELADVWRAKEVTITTRRPKQINVDGELIGKTPAEFSIRPRLLEVFVPGPRNAGHG
jgi:YegS/Rv2252/BmrU family lipid kinase